MEDYGRRLAEQHQQTESLSQRSKARIEAIKTKTLTDLSRHVTDSHSKLSQAAEFQMNELQASEKRIQEKRLQLQNCLERLREMQKSLGSAQGGLMKMRAGVGGELGQLRAEVEEVKRKVAAKTEELKAAAEAIRNEMQQEIQTQKAALDAKASEATTALDQIEAFLDQQL